MEMGLFPYEDQMVTGVIVKEEGSEPSAKGVTIYLNGGAQIVRSLMGKKLIDECIVSIIPILLGEGIKLFDGGFPKIDLELISSENYSTGLVQVRYWCKK